VTAFDDWLDGIGARIDELPTRSTVALFAACASGLLPELGRWAAHRGHDTEPLAESALATARAYALTGDPPPDTQALLASIEEATPPGDSPDEVSSTAAQDCWICVGTSIRVIADPGFKAGMSIEYALEPILQQATERLYDVTQLGSGPDEDTQTDTILREPDVSRALDFCSWAVAFLAERTTPSEADLSELTNHATALTP
jgi:hypothetical protein